MITVHGWAKISESYRECDDSDTALSKAVEQIREKVYSIIGTPEEKAALPLQPWENEWNKYHRYYCRDHVAILFTRLHGSPNLSVMAHANHSWGRWEAIYDLFKLIADVAPGSYGLLYCRDDEDQNGYDNSMQVYVLKKGKLVLTEDHYLSPCIPELEEV